MTSESIRETSQRDFREASEYSITVERKAQMPETKRNFKISRKLQRDFSDFNLASSVLYLLSSYV